MEKDSVVWRYVYLSVSLHKTSSYYYDLRPELQNNSKTCLFVRYGKTDDINVFNSINTINCNYEDELEVDYDDGNFTKGEAKFRVMLLKDSKSFEYYSKLLVKQLKVQIHNKTHDRNIFLDLETNTIEYNGLYLKYYTKADYISKIYQGFILDDDHDITKYTIYKPFLYEDDIKDVVLTCPCFRLSSSFSPSFSPSLSPSLSSIERDEDNRVKPLENTSLTLMKDSLIGNINIDGHGEYCSLYEFDKVTDLIATSYRIIDLQEDVRVKNQFIRNLLYADGQKSFEIIRLTNENKELKTKVDRLSIRSYVKTGVVIALAATSIGLLVFTIITLVNYGWVFTY